jgi:D-alanyl-D-alanine carboxypeptidase
VTIAHSTRRPAWNRGFQLLILAATAAVWACNRTNSDVAPHPQSDIALNPAIASQIDALMRNAVAQQHIAAVSVAVARRGSIIYAKGFGYRDLSKRLPATPQTIYNIASNSKQFTAACVLLLQQDGKLDIDDTLSRYLPGFPAGDKITIREVLNHTSGLTDYLDLIDNNTLTPAKVRAAVYRAKLKFRPGSKWEYSNTNYIVAGLVVEHASGMPFDDFLRSRIIAPLGLHSTTVGTSPLDLPGGAVGYTVNKGRHVVPVNPQADSAIVLDYPDGAINSTALDIAAWDDALDSGRVISKDLLKVMFTPAPYKADWPGGYGLGVGLDTVAGHREILHTGGWTGFVSENATIPDERFAVVMLSNTDTFERADLTRRIIALFYP